MHRGDCENPFEPWSARKRRIRGNKSTLLKYVGSPGSNGSKGENREEKRRKFVEGNERRGTFSPRGLKLTSGAW